MKAPIMYYSIFAIILMALSSTLAQEVTRNFAGFTVTYPEGQPEDAFIAVPFAAPQDLRATVAVDSAGEITSGNVANEFKVSVNGFSVTVEAAQFDFQNNVLVFDGTIYLTGLGSLTLEGIEINASGVVSSGTFNVQNDALNIDGFMLVLTSAQFGTDGIETRGRITLPSAVGTLSATATVGTDLAVVMAADASGAAIRLGGFSFEPGSISYSSGNFTLAGTLRLPNNFGEMPVSEMKIDSAKIASGPEFDMADVTLNLSGFRLTPTSATLRGDGMVFEGTLELPAGLGTAMVSEFDVDDSGRLTCKQIAYTGGTLTAGGFTVTVDSLNWDGDHLEAWGSLSLPENLGSVRIKRFQIDSQGNVSGGEVSAQMDSLSLWGFSFIPESITLDLSAGLVELSGTLTVPQIGTVSIQGMQFSSTGIESTGSFQMSGNHTFQSFAVNLKSVAFQNQTLVISAELVLPLDVATIPFSLRASPDQVTVENISVEGVTASVYGFTVALDSAGFGSNDDIVLSGYLEVPKLGRLKVNGISVTHGGVITGGSITVEGASVTIGGFSATLNSAVFETDEVKVSGQIALAGIGTLTIENLEINSDGSYEGGDFSFESNLSIQNFPVSASRVVLSGATLVIDGAMELPAGIGSLSVDNLKITPSLDLSIDSLRIDGLHVSYKDYDVRLLKAKWANGVITLAGELSLGENLGTVWIHDLSLDSQGNLRGGQFQWQGAEINYSGFSVELTSCTFQDANIILRGAIALPNSAGNVKVDSLVINSTGIVTMGRASLEGPALKWRGFEVSVASLTLADGYITVTGSLTLGSLGKLVASDLQISSSGDFVGGSIELAEMRTLKYAGFAIQINSAHFENDAVEIDGSIDLPGGRGTLNIESLDIKVDGSVANGNITFQGNPINFKGCELALDKVELSEGAITADAALSLPNNLTTVTAKSVKITYPFNVSVDSISVGEATLSYSGFTVQLRSTRFQGDNVLVSGSLSVPTLGRVLVTDLTIDSSGNFSGGTVRYSGQEWQWDQFKVVISSIGLKDGYVTLDGSINLPKNLGTLAVSNLTINISGEVAGGSIEVENVSIAYGGFTITLESATFEGDEIEIDGSLDLPNEMGKININDFEIFTNGNINAGTATYEGPGFNLAGFGVNLSTLFLSDAGVRVDGSLSLPASIGGSVEVNGLWYKSTGEVSVDSVVVNNISASYNGFSLKLTDGSWKNDALHLSGTLTLPGTYGELAIQDIVLSSNGTFSGGTFRITDTTIQFKGFTVSLTSADFADGNLTISGQINLANNNGTLTVNNLTLDSNGLVSPGTVTLEGTQISWRDYKVTVDSLSLKQDAIAINGSLDLGALGKLVTHDMEITSNWEFRGGSIELTEVKTLSYANFSIQLSNAVFQMDEIEINGSISLGDHGTITISGLNISTDGTIGGGTLDFDGPAITYQGYSLQLDKIELRDNAIVAEASLTGVTERGTVRARDITITYPFNVSVGRIEVEDVGLTYLGFVVSVDSVTMRDGNFYYTGSIDIPRVGKLSVDGLGMNASGEVVSPGTISFKGRTWSWGTLAVTVDSIGIEQDYAVMNAKVSLQNDMGTIAISELKVNSTGDVMGGKVAVKDVQLAYAGFTLTLASAVLEGDEIEIDGSLTLPSDIGEISVEDMEIRTDGTVVGGTLSYSGEGLSVAGFNVSVTSVAFDDQAVSIDGTLTLPASVGGQVDVTGLKISASGEISLDSIDVSNLSIAYNGFSVSLTSCAWSAGNLTLSGNMTLPANYGTVKIENLSLDSKGTISGGSFQVTGTTLSYRDFDLTLREMVFTSDGNLQLAGEISLPNNIATLNLSGLVLNSGGIVSPGAVSVQTGELSWRGYAVKVDSIGLSEGLVTLSGQLNLGSFGTLVAKDLQITDEGEFTGGSVHLTGVDTLHYAGFAIALTEADLQADAVEIDGSISLPQNAGVIDITGLNISSDGSISGGTLEYSGSGLSYKGCTLDLESLSFKDNAISADASLILPNNLATITAKDVTVTYPLSISVESLEVGNASVDWDNFNVALSSAKFIGDKLSLSGSISIPNFGKVSVTDLLVDASGDFSGGQFSYEGTTWTWGSLSVSVDSLSLTEDDYIAISGSVTLPKNIGTIRASGLKLDSQSGTVISGKLSATTSLSYAGCSIDDINADLNGDYIELGGTITLANNLGTISVSNLDLSTKDGSVSGGTFTWSGDTLSFSGCKVWIEFVDLQQDHVSVSGDLILPANMGTISADEAKITHGGTFSVGTINYSGITLGYKGFSFAVSSLSLTGIAVKVSGTATVPGGISFGLKNLEVSKTGFSGGELDFSNTSITFKNFTVSIREGTSFLKSRNGILLNASITLPDNKGTADVDSLIIATSGLDASHVSFDYTDLMSLIPGGFGFKVTEAEFIDDGFRVTGNISMAGMFSLAVDNLTVTSSEINLEGVYFSAGELSLGSYKFAGLEFDFESKNNTWMVRGKGGVKLPGDIVGMTLEVFVASNGDAEGDLTVNTSIPLDASGFTFANPGGGVGKQGSVYYVKLHGDLYFISSFLLEFKGELILPSTAVISAELKTNVLTFEVADSKVVLDMPGKHYWFEGTVNIADMITSKSRFDLQTNPFKLEGGGETKVLGKTVSSAYIYIDKVKFHIDGNMTTDVFEVAGSLDFWKEKMYAEMYGKIYIQGWANKEGRIKLYLDHISSSGEIDLGIASGSYDFYARINPGFNISVEKFKAEAEIGWNDFHIVETWVDITPEQFSGHAKIDFALASGEVDFEGNKGALTYFKGNMSIGMPSMGWTVARADVLYNKPTTVTTVPDREVTETVYYYDDDNVQAEIDALFDQAVDEVIAHTKKKAQPNLDSQFPSWFPSGWKEPVRRLAKQAVDDAIDQQRGQIQSELETLAEAILKGEEDTSNLSINLSKVKYYGYKFDLNFFGPQVSGLLNMKIDDTVRQLLLQIVDLMANNRKSRTVTRVIPGYTITNTSPAILKANGNISLGQLGGMSAGFVTEEPFDYLKSAYVEGNFNFKWPLKFTFKLGCFSYTVQQDFAFDLGYFRIDYAEGGSFKKNVDYDIAIPHLGSYKITVGVEVKSGSVRFSADFPVIGHQDISFSI